MPYSSLPELVSGLSDLSDLPLRQRTTEALAARLGAEELLLLVRDPVLHHWIPAVGLPQTVAGGPAWRALLVTCERPGRHVAEVDLPPPQLRRAIALATADTVVVLVGSHIEPDALSALEQLLPLLGALLRSQQQVAFSRAETIEARQAAARAQSLAEALDAARSAAALLNAELRVEQQRRDEFLTMMTQELHNPLAPLIKAVKALRQADAGSETVPVPVLDMMARKLTHLSRLADDLLDVSRAFRGEIDLERAPVAMQVLLQEALENSLPFLESHGHRVEMQLPEEPVMVDADRIRLTQVISKLLHNAAKYSQPHGCIAVRVARDGAEGLVEVADDGIGISPGMMPRIFEMFTQVPVRVDPAGMGLGVGLTLVRIVMALHGGNIKATSAGVGRGSVFTMRLPLLENGESSATPSDGAASETKADVPLRVLVVDGNAESAQSLAGLFRLLGHRAAVASDGPMALAYLSEHHADLILLDIDLRGMDSLEVARRLRLSPHGHSRIVALTESSGENDQGGSLDARFDGQLVKPADRKALEAALAGMTTGFQHRLRSA